MLYSVKRVHFIGIGGIGMSGIAELLSNKNFIVTGSDLSSSPNVDRLRNLGIEISIGHSDKNIANAELVIYSDAIPEENVELNAAKSKNLLVYSRAKMISEIAKLNNSTVAVAGTHGKTTTTSMIGSILKSLNLDPTIIVGGVVKSIESNSVLGSGDTFVVEADEYNKSLLQLNPTIAVINNIDFEHVECPKKLSNRTAKALSHCGHLAHSSTTTHKKRKEREIKKNVVEYVAIGGPGVATNWWEE